MTKHPQRPFQLANGGLTTVDADIYHLLHELREAGVITQFSCQGTDTRAAYVLCEGTGAVRFFRKIRRDYKKGLLAPRETTFVNQILAGKRHYEIGHFFDKFDRYFRFEWTRKGNPQTSGYAIEYSLSTKYGLRIALRCPSSQLTKAEQVIYSQNLQRL